MAQVKIEQFRRPQSHNNSEYMIKFTRYKHLFTCVQITFYGTELQLAFRILEENVEDGATN